MKNTRKIIVMPDSFKGTMSSLEVCAITEGAIRAVLPDAEVVTIPVADGGEGSVDAFIAAVGGRTVRARVPGPFFEETDAFYGLIDDGETAVIEMAACAGLPLAGADRNPARATTFGVGRLMLAAAERGARKMIVALGGSATNDGGCGAAAAAGVVFRDAAGDAFVPVGGTLRDICHIDVSGLAPALRHIEIVTMCDIDNPLHGPTGAARVFAPQKGADADMTDSLDEGLRRLDALIERELGARVGTVPGAGAAGGMGAGMIAFFRSELKPGIDVVLDAARFDEAARDADLILTGEGRIDGQSLRGKVVIGIARRAKALSVPVVALVGQIGDSAEKAYAEGVSGIFAINRSAADFETLRHTCREDLRFTAENVIRFRESLLAAR